MIFYPPVRFDLNEWFLISVSVLGWSVYLLIKNHFSLIVLIGLWLFNFYMAQTVDFAIALGPPIDLYDINDRPQYEWFDFFLYFFTYLPQVLMVVWGYDRFRPRGWRLAGYLVVVALGTTVMEIVAKLCNVYHFKGWSSYYSFLVYIVTSAANIAFYRFIALQLSKGRQQGSVH